jgi:hypothetical protein
LCRREGEVRENIWLARSIATLATDDSLETWHNGNIHYNNTGDKTPFYPSALADFTRDERMMQIAISENLINSFIYQAYINNKFDIIVSELLLYRTSNSCK